MTPRPINPIEAVEGARRAGLIFTAEEALARVSHFPGEEFDRGPTIKLPCEAGIAPLQKSPRKRMYSPRPKKEKRYVIHPKDRPDLFQ